MVESPATTKHWLITFDIISAILFEAMATTLASLISLDLENIS
jgi:hypothetical protein